MATKDRLIMTSLGRISTYLPNARLDHLSRFRVDKKGRIWTDEDTLLIVLRGHLIIEHELVDLCNRFFPQPEVLPDRLNFDTRLRLVRAVLGDDGLPKVVYDILMDLNKIRNNLAHNLDPKNLHNDLRRFIKRFSTFRDFESLLKSDEVQERLNTCIVVLCGMLGSIRPESSSEAE
jgi:hypothetical protein